ncbi:4'-phosphopantetheinyl transferase superfamily protein [Pseudomonas sp. C27(2019)]|uniref:4'-phosphopantetheinyl transferase family protein n=1 Tax=Pseudomonas sp. C27(2019) TaxID=2604941 RepID=UPI0012471762|nr:4'-phosphopantetheinyl transferase superfamily protein [Pseudomonas sp. C27(2019)]QEY59029.1 4'-phosphopantetheinyl transferase superfamily protein [Pseudomonas sp. C27(2019)]
MPVDFLSQLQQHWPFVTALPNCTLVSACFNQDALTPELVADCAIDLPKATSKRQAEFLAARLCARKALHIQTGLASLPTQQENSRIPLWPAQSCGSMSHSHSLAAALVGDSHTWQGLGIDIEKPLSPKRAQRLAKNILTTAEHDTYALLNSGQQAMYLTVVFSFKESLFKALNPLTARYFSFHDAQVLDLNVADSGHARLRLAKDLSRDWPAGSQLEGQFSQLHGSVITLVSIASRR